ncbi:protein spaetzle 3 [Chelonus insularis]|uniref:protein spaetzle 3 n=1 Tax=Chelonus insularis TaxID=460826 RepID=UPI0015887652|nr:protein spaetzle 3 [Chelonus insularis]
MSLTNFSLPFPVATPSYLFNPSMSEQTPANNLRLNAALPPSSHFHEERHFQNQPYLPPVSYQRQQHQFHHQERSQQRKNYQYYKQQPQSQTQNQYKTPSIQSQQEYSSQTTRFNDYEDDYRRIPPREQSHIQPDQEMRPPSPVDIQRQSSSVANHNVPQANQDQDHFTDHPEGYTKVSSGSYGNPRAKTSVHAVIDYDDDDDETNNGDDYYDENIPKNPRVTPIQGPIFLKNGTVPVVPLYSYPQYNNGTFVQIPILWTALSVALGVELRGDLVRGTPCIKKYHQLFCPTAGKTYPIERIELFIDENKALMKRMYGDFEMDKDHGPETSSSPRRRKRRSFDDYDFPDGGPSLRRDPLKPGTVEGGDSFFSQIRNTRQAPKNVPKNTPNDTGRVDVCESKVEVVTPYWASNSAGKIRAIVNTQHFEQAIHQEVCSKTQTNRCSGECGCEQKYKWHRLLAYDPEDDCKGIFMDWFLFPSCCVCRCDPHAKFPGTATMNNRSG